MVVRLVTVNSSFFIEGFYLLIIPLVILLKIRDEVIPFPRIASSVNAGFRPLSELGRQNELAASKSYISVVPLGFQTNSLNYSTALLQVVFTRGWETAH
jgi:hypothetical protein